MRMNWFNKRNKVSGVLLIVLSIFFVIALTACGGGGGGGSAPETTVTTASPAAGTTEVTLNSQVQATFSANMDSSTINTNTFTIASPSGVKVSGTVSYDDTTKIVTFTPSINLAPLTTYTATVAGVKDKAGDTMNTPYSWSFTTITGFWAYNFDSDSDYFISATKAGEGNHCIVYLEQGRSVGQDTIDSIISQFDNAIYPQETSAFGSEPNPGIDGNAKIFILLLDIKDGYTPSSGYIAGYFDPLNEYDISISFNSNQKEVFYMDINPGAPGDSQFLRTLAHEFQHMINWQQKTNLLGVHEDTWLDEAMSEIAPVVCGYGPDYEEVYGYELLPWDSLVGWNDTLNDYNTVYMWAQYMKDRVTNIDGNGHGVFWNIDHTGNVGINAVNSALSTVGYGKDFPGVFRDWSIANYLGLTTISGHQEWSYSTIHTEAGYPIGGGFTLPGLPVSDVYHINAPTVGGLYMWGLDYFKFTKTGQGTVTWTKTNSTDEAAFIDTSNNTVSFNMISGTPYSYTNTGILIARNPTNIGKFTVNGGGTMVFTSIVSAGLLVAGDKTGISQYFGKSYINSELAGGSAARLTPKVILSRIASDPVAKAISDKTGRPISICVNHFFREREKVLRQGLLMER